MVWCCTPSVERSLDGELRKSLLWCLILPLTCRAYIPFLPFQALNGFCACCLLRQLPLTASALPSVCSESDSALCSWLRRKCIQLLEPEPARNEASDLVSKAFFLCLQIQHRLTQTQMFSHSSCTIYPSLSHPAPLSSSLSKMTGFFLHSHSKLSPLLLPQILTGSARKGL